VAESKHFGNPKVLQFGDRTRPGDSGHCAQCEAMLADALDGTLSASDQEVFDLHMAGCDPCSRMLADARRGAAFLELLRTPAPEPLAALLDRILAQTSGAQAVAEGIEAAGLAGAHSAQPIAPAAAYSNLGGNLGGNLGNLVPFPTRMATVLRRSGFGQIALQPRLVMTAAMAFFSIALTMNLTGVRLQDLRASDLRPSSLKRDFTAVNTHVVQYYEGLRVVYELESRVHDLQSATENNDAGSQSTPQSASPNPQASPDGEPPAGEHDRPGQPGPANHAPAAPPEQRPRPATNPAPGSGTSRREGPGSQLSLAALANPGDPADGEPAGPLNAARIRRTIPANSRRTGMEGSLA
jgi:hypothetical protein